MSFSAPSEKSLLKILFSQHFYSGLQVASGVMGIVLLGYLVTGGDLATTALMVTGAVSVSVADIPSPVRHKRYELLAALALATLVAVAVGIARHWQWALGLCVLLISFSTAMMNAYGKKAMPVSFAAILAMVMTLGGPEHPLQQMGKIAAWFAAGGGAYYLYALVASHFLAFRTRQQAFAESCFELAQYLRIKAGFYERDAVLDDCYGALTRQQVVVVDKQQSARDFVLGAIRNEREAQLAQTLLAQFDLFELVLSSHTDYALLQRHYGGSDAMLLLRDLVDKIALDLDRIAYQALRNRQAPHPVNYKAEIFAIRYEIERLRQEQGGGDSEDGDALKAFSGVFERICQCVAHVQSLHELARAPCCPKDVAAGINLQPFLTPASYSPRVLIEHCHLASPFFRYALRMTMAMGCGFVFAYLLSSAAHSYWILLTIAVVMRSSFSMTLQRRTDRILGNVAGCVLTALLLEFTRHPAALLLALFASLAVAHAFVLVRYRYTAIASCVMALLQIHFLNPDLPFVISERLIDTLAGALLAYGFSFVLPSWEYHGLPRRIAELLEANRRYVDAVLGGVADLDYRIARKRLFDGIAAVAGAFGGMLKEPKARHRAVAETQAFITANYLFAAHVAALRVLLKHLPGDEKQRLLAALTADREKIRGYLTDAQTLAARGADENAPQPDAVLTPVTNGNGMEIVPPGSTTDIGPHPLIARRIAMLSADAREILRLAEGITAE